MTDINTAMATTPAEPKPIDMAKPPYYFPTIGNPDATVLQELTLYASRRLNKICFVHVKGESLKPPAVFEIHTSIREYSYIGEVVQLVETTMGWMGTVLFRPREGGSTNVFPPDGVLLNAPATTQPTVMMTTSNKIKIAKPPRFTGDKKNWEGFILAVDTLAVDTYLMAYHEKFKNDKQKIWFVISYLGTEDSSQCVALDWLQNWKEENTYNHILHADDYEKFLKDLCTAFEDPNLKVNATNDLQQL